jgi:hypothetical protein
MNPSESSFEPGMSPITKILSCMDPKDATPDVVEALIQRRFADDPVLLEKCMTIASGYRQRHEMIQGLGDMWFLWRQKMGLLDESATNGSNAENDSPNASNQSDNAA